MSNKKGISDVITTVLIVLLSLVAIAIVWSFISPLITKSGQQVAQTQACLSASLEVTDCKLSGTMYNVTVHRNAGAADVKEIKLIFAKSDGTSQAINQSSNLPGELETKLYQVPFSNASNVAVAAGIADAKGNVGYCTPSQPTNCA